MSNNNHQQYSHANGGRRRPTYDELDQAITKTLKENDHVKVLEDQILTNHNDWILSENRIDNIILNKPPTKSNKKLYGSYLTASSSTTAQSDNNNSGRSSTSKQNNNKNSTKKSFLPKFYAKPYQDIHIEEGPFSSYEYDFEGSNLINTNSGRKYVYNSTATTTGTTSKNQCHSQKDEEQECPQQFQWCSCRMTIIIRLLCYTAIFLFSLFCVWITHELKSHSNIGTTPSVGGNTSATTATTTIGDDDHLWFFHGFLLFLWLIVFSFLWYVYSIVA